MCSLVINKPSEGLLQSLPSLGIYFMQRKPKHISNPVKRAIERDAAPNIETWVKDSGLPKHAKKWVIASRDEAFKSDFHTFKVGCVLVYKNRIIGRGHNQLKTDPYQKIYNNRYRLYTNEPEFSNTCGHTIHAEIDALTDVLYPVAQQINWKKVKVYVYRLTLNQETSYMGIALPCPACAGALYDRGIRKVYYTTGRLDKPFGCCDL